MKDFKNMRTYYCIALLVLSVAQQSYAQGIDGVYPRPTEEAKKDAEKAESDLGETECECKEGKDFEEKNLCTDAHSDKHPRCAAAYTLFIKEQCKVKKGVCQWYQRCGAVGDNEALTKCVTKKKHFCGVRQYLGGAPGAETSDGANPVIYTHECKLPQSCCDFECCNPGYVCVEMTGKPQGASRQNLEAFKTQIKQSGGDFYYDFLLWDLEAVMRNDWKQPDGSDFKHRPRTCVKVLAIDPLEWNRMVALPIINWVFIIMLFVIIVCKAGFCTILKQTRMISPIWLLVFSLCLSFGPFNHYALILSLAALATMFWPWDQKMNGWLALGQFMVLWYILGGSQFFVHGSQIGWVNYLADYNYGDITGLMDRCNSYFSKYFDIGSQRNFYWPDDQKYWGFCSEAWIGWEIGFAHFSLLNLVLMFTWSLWSFVEFEEEPDVWCCCKKKTSAAASVQPEPKAE